MITKFLNPERIISILFAVQLGSFISVQYYEEIEDLLSSDFSMKYLLCVILSSLYATSTLVGLKYYTFKTNVIEKYCPMYRWMYYIRYFKNIVVTHTMLSLFFYNYLVRSILYNYTAMLFYGWCTILYLYISSQGNRKITSTNITKYTLSLAVIIGLTGYVAYASWMVMENDLNEEWDDWRYLSIVASAGVFALSTILSSCIISDDNNIALNSYVQAYLVEQLIIISCVYSLMYYNIYIRIGIYTVLSIFLSSDRLFHIVINKYIVTRKTKVKKMKMKMKEIKEQLAEEQSKEETKESEISHIS